MKHFLRISVTLVVLAIIGVACYFFFFKPDSDLKTFNSLSDTIDYRENIGVDAKLNSLISADGHGQRKVVFYKVEEFVPREGSTNTADFVVGGQGYDYVITNGEKEIIKTEEIDFVHNFLDSSGNLVSSNYASIVDYRNVLFADGDAVNWDSVDYISGTNRYSYMVIEKSLDEIFDYYFAYAQICDGVKNSSQKAMDKAIKEYRKALENFNTQLNNVLTYQLSYQLETTEADPVKTVASVNDIDYMTESYEYQLDSNSSARTELTARYLELIKVYRNTLLKYCDVIDNLKNIVVDYVFGGELIIEAKTVKLDLTLEAVRAALKTNDNENVVSDRINAKLDDASVFISGQIGNIVELNENEDELLAKYNSVVGNAKDDLVSILNLTNAEMNDIADNSATEELESKYNATYLPKIVEILNLYGFGVFGG